MERFDAYVGVIDAALQEAQIARQLAPYDAFMLGHVAATFVENGQPQQGLEWMEDAARREPGREAVYNYRRGWAYTVLGESERALASLKDAVDWVDVPLLMAINYVHLGKFNEARAEVKAALAMRPDFTCATWASSYFYSDPKIVAVRFCAAPSRLRRRIPISRSPTVT